MTISWCWGLIDKLAVRSGTGKSNGVFRGDLTGAPKSIRRLLCHSWSRLQSIAKKCCQKSSSVTCFLDKVKPQEVRLDGIIERTIPSQEIMRDDCYGLHTGPRSSLLPPALFGCPRLGEFALTVWGESSGESRPKASTTPTA